MVCSLRQCWSNSNTAKVSSAGFGVSRDGTRSNEVCEVEMISGLESC